MLQASKFLLHLLLLGLECRVHLGQLLQRSFVLVDLVQTGGQVGLEFGIFALEAVVGALHFLNPLLHVFALFFAQIRPIDFQHVNFFRQLRYLDYFDFKVICQPLRLVGSRLPIFGLLGKFRSQLFDFGIQFFDPLLLVNKVLVQRFDLGTKLLDELVLGIFLVL